MCSLNLHEIYHKPSIVIIIICEIATIVLQWTEEYVAAVSKQHQIIIDTSHQDEVNNRGYTCRCTVSKLWGSCVITDQ